ncbi:MAG TPA: hypothetical protein PL182_08005 [Pseudobdellovibrionaceae bacterium]|nr:hypothetical protein [Pseudobdellovibrionaceae bacterium]
MNRKIMILTLIAIALAGTTSYASRPPPGSNQTQEIWNPDVVADASDPGLVFTPQGANTYAMIDPSCGPCVAAMKAQLRLRDQRTVYTPNAPLSPALRVSEEESVDGQQ